MTLSIPISPSAEAYLKEAARVAGVEVTAYVANDLERRAAAAAKWAEISAAGTDAFERTGMTEDELTDFINAEIHAMRAEQRAAGQER